LELEKSHQEKTDTLAFPRLKPEPVAYALVGASSKLTLVGFVAPWPPTTEQHLAVEDWLSAEQGKFLDATYQLNGPTNNHG
jgi:hypothetical protein